MTTPTVSGKVVVRRESRWRLLFRFAVVGVSNAVIDLGVFNLLIAVDPTRRPLQLVAYNTVAVALALANSYWWNSRWTFRSGDDVIERWSLTKRRVLFVLQGLLNIAVNDLAVAGVASLLQSAQVLGTSLADNVAKIAGMTAASAVSFLAMRFVVFQASHHEPLAN